MWDNTSSHNISFFGSHHTLFWSPFAGKTTYSCKPTCRPILPCHLPKFPSYYRIFGLNYTTSACKFMQKTNYIIWRLMAFAIKAETHARPFLSVTPNSTCPPIFEASNSNTETGPSPLSPVAHLRHFSKKTSKFSVSMPWFTTLFSWK